MRIGLALLLSACATLAPAQKPAPNPEPPVAPAPPPEADVVGKQLAALLAHADAVETARDDALWSFWSTGAGGPPDAVWKGHEALLGDDALRVVRRARELKLTEPASLDRLEELIVSERLGAALRDADAAFAGLEASVRFPYEGRDVLYRDLGGALAAEKNPTRRAALWAASLPAAKQLDAALTERDAKLNEALAKVSLTAAAFAALVRRADLDAAVKWADAFLTTTEARWRARLTSAHVATRGDLPAWLKPTPALDGVFPKGRIAERGTQVLAGLGLYGLPQLTLDLTDNPRKQPLPLTVSGVRVSYKPRGGWKDQQALLAELGRALALRHTTKPERRVLETTAQLFASLAWNRAWLEDQGVAPAIIPAAVELGGDQLLYTLRRAAGDVLTPPDLGRALALSDDPARTRLELEPLAPGLEPLRAASAAFALVRHLEVQGGTHWWSSPKAADVLREFWKTGELPEAVRTFALTGESLLAALSTPMHGGVRTELVPR